MNLASSLTLTLLIGAGLALVVIIWNYAKGLKSSPRDLWLLFGYKFVEYSAYAAMNMVAVLWLSKDCKLGDVWAGSFISAWSICLSVVAMFAGALVDAIGIRRTMLISVVFLIIARLVFAFITEPTVVFIFGFMPMAVGFAIVAPVISVAIKRYTTKESCTLGFGLFYVVMNIGYGVGGTFLDWIRDHLAAKSPAGKVLDENAGMDILGHHFSTYQMVFLVGLVATLISLIITFFIRDGVEMTDDGEVVVTPVEPRGGLMESLSKGAADTCRLLWSTVVERFFWIYVGLLSMTLFVRFVFFHFHYTFPTYAIRVLGEGARISIYSVLNPFLVVFLVPIVAAFTKKVSSYKMMIWGSAISALSCFIAILSPDLFAGWTRTAFGEIVFVKVLRMYPDMGALLASPPAPEYWTLIVFVTVFTIGEAIWSPRLMQFTAEIAPKGKEGTYIALSVLPFFLAKFVVGPMSGLLLATYTPLDAAGKALTAYPHHHMVWIWIGGMAVLSPMGLLLFRNWFLKNTAHHEPE